MHCSSSEAEAQLERLVRESLSLSLSSPALRLHSDPFPGKNGVVQLSLTLLGVGVMAGGGMIAGTLLSIQMLPQRGKGSLGLGLSLGLGRVTCWSICPTSGTPGCPTQGFA